MALKPKTLKRVDEAMRRFICFLKYRAIGPHVLSKAELKDLIRSGMITPGQAPKTAVARAYLLTHQQSTAEPAPKETRHAAIDFLERMFGRYADKAGEQFTADLLGQVESQLMPFADRTEGQHIYGVLKDKDSHSKYLGNVLNEKVADWSNRWKTIVTTELARASNYGAMDAILHNNRSKSPDEVYVYKTGPHDGNTCEWCVRFWFQSDGVTPKIYTMSELMANGSNVGKKRSEWKPSVDLVHPNDRHTLVELRPGFGFEKGTIVYRGIDHDEYKSQRGSR